MSSTKKQPKPFVVAYGGEDFLLDRILELGLSCDDRWVIRLDGEGLADHEVVSQCEQHSLDGRDLLVVVDNAHKLKGNKVLMQYVKDKDPEDASVILVAVLRSEEMSDLWKTAAAKGRLEHYAKFKPWEKDRIKKRILEEADRLGLGLDSEVPDIFLKYLGDNLRRTVNELRKLSLVTPKDRLVTKQDVALVIAPDVPVESYNVGDCAVNKDASGAMRLASTLFKNIGDGAALSITADLLRQVEKLISARQMLDKGVSEEDVAARLGMHPFRFKKELLPRAQKHTLMGLRNQMENLCRLDAQVKGAARSKRTLVELAILSIAA